MKIALITDTHAGARNDSPIFQDHFLKFYSDVFFPEIKKRGIDTVINLGDQFDRRKYINFKTLDIWKEKVFNPLSALGIKYHIILGNHDVFYKNTNQTNSPSILLREYDNIIIHDKAKTITIDGLKICILPWINQDNFDEAFEEISNTQATVCFGHLEIQGFQMHKNQINTDKGFSPNVFRHFDIVYSGHFHHRSSNGNIMYLGSPYEMVWSDYGDARGFHIFDTQTKELEFIENPNKIFHKIHYSDSPLEHFDFQDYKNKFVKLIVEKKTNLLDFEKFILTLEENDPSDVVIMDEYDISECQVDDNELDRTKDNLTIIMDYVDNLDLDKKDKVKSKMTEAYLESLQKYDNL